jgi:CRISPR-associated Csx10 family RAMP protein
LKHYWLRLFPEQPVVLRDETTIPAAALRGAIASMLLITCVPGHEHDTGPCNAQCRYWSIFGEGANLRIGAAYAGSGDSTEPFLATARTCSLSPGFKTAGGHGVFDVAIRQWIFEEMCAEPQHILAPFSLHCPTCDAPLMPCEGTATRLGEREFTAIGAREAISSPVTTHHASLNRARKQVVERFEVTGKAINRSLYFVARLDVPDRLDTLLRDTVGDRLWIGGRRSRGMGEMRVEFAARKQDDPIFNLPLNERIARFNRAVRAEYRFYAAGDPGHRSSSEGEWYFTLDLHSPALVAYAAAPSVVPMLDTLPSVIAVRHWLSTETVGGWHGAAGLPRRTQPGIRGVILYRVPAETNRTAVEEMLAFVEAEGVGAGRERGFGAVTICDPFHLHVDPI